MINMIPPLFCLLGHLFVMEEEKKIKMNLLLLDLSAFPEVKIVAYVIFIIKQHCSI